MTPQIYNPSISRRGFFETRRIQKNGNSLIVSIPQLVAAEVGIKSQDVVRIYIPRSNPHQIIIEKIVFEDLNQTAVPLPATAE